MDDQDGQGDKGGGGQETEGTDKEEHINLQGVPDTKDMVQVKHAGGGKSSGSTG